VSIPDNARPILDFIGHKEAPLGYGQVYGKSKVQPPRDITTMSINEVLAWQDASVAAGSKSSAAGRYQVIRKTLRGLMGQLGLSGDEVFSSDMQDQLGFALLKGAGYTRWAAGAMPTEKFANGIAGVWASMPLVTGPKAGSSRYAGIAGNKALTSPDKFLAALGGATKPSAVGAEASPDGLDGQGRYVSTTTGAPPAPLDLAGAGDANPPAGPAPGFPSQPGATAQPRLSLWASLAAAILRLLSSLLRGSGKRS